MKVLICGSRNWTNKKIIEDFIKSLPKGTWIIEGGCRGADKIAKEVAICNGYGLSEYPALWHRYGKAAGPIRNQKMLNDSKPDVVVAFHDNLEKGKGTKDMVNRAKKAGIPVRIIRSKEECED